MKKQIALIITAVLAASTVSSCGKSATSGSSSPRGEQTKSEHQWQNSETLNEWQKSLLKAEGLPTDIEQLSPSQKRSIQHIYEMITYLNEKYDEKFVYAGYVEPGVMDEEVLYARSLSDEKQRAVTVKIDDNGDFTDDYQSKSVSDYCEVLIDNWIHSYLETDDYRYYSVVNACDIQMSEIKNDDFQWKYAAENMIFIKMNEYDFDTLEKFAVNYAKFLYGHHISGSHRINVVNMFNDQIPDDYWHSIGWIGFYDLGFINSHNTIHTSSSRIVVNESGRSDGYERTSQEYSIEEYFSKY